jgi:hypothetical protein
VGRRSVPADSPHVVAYRGRDCGVFPPFYPPSQSPLTHGEGRVDGNPHPNHNSHSTPNPHLNSSPTSNPTPNSHSDPHPDPHSNPTTNSTPTPKTAPSPITLLLPRSSTLLLHFHPILSFLSLLTLLRPNPFP